MRRERQRAPVHLQPIERHVLPVQCRRHPDARGRPEQAGHRRHPAGDAERAVHIQPGHLARHRGLQVQCRAAGQRHAADRGQRRDIGNVQMRLPADRAARPRAAAQRQQGVGERERHWPVGNVQPGGGLQRQRRCLQQVRLGAGNADALGAGGQRHLSLVAGDGCRQVVQRGARRGQPGDRQRRVRLRPGERAVDMRVQRHRLPGQIRARRHRRCIGRHIQIGSVAGDVDFSARLGPQGAGRRGQVCRRRRPRPIDGRLQRQRPDVRKAGDKGGQPVRRLLGLERRGDPGGIDVALRMKAPTAVQLLDRRLGRAGLQRRQMCAGVHRQHGRRPRHRRRDADAIDMQYIDIHPHRQLKRTTTRRRRAGAGGGRQPRHVHLTGNQPRDAGIARQQQQGVPVQRRALHRQPRSLGVAHLDPRHAQHVREAAGEAVQRDHAAGDLRRQPFRQLPPRRRVQRDHDSHDQRQRQRHQHGEFPAQPAQRAAHQKACPMPI